MLTHMDIIEKSLIGALILRTSTLNYTDFWETKNPGEIQSCKHPSVDRVRVQQTKGPQPCQTMGAFTESGGHRSRPCALAKHWWQCLVASLKADINLSTAPVSLYQHNSYTFRRESLSRNHEACRQWLQRLVMHRHIGVCHHHLIRPWSHVHCMDALSLVQI